MAIFLSLLVVGVVSASVVRHLVQTLPLWIVVWLGLRDSSWTRWAAFPVFAFWLALMAVVWSFLLGWTRIISGTFSPTEIAMTVVVAAAAVVGLIAALRDWRSRDLTRASVLAAVVLLLQLGAFVVSFKPGLAHDPRTVAGVSRRSAWWLASASPRSAVRRSPSPGLSERPVPRADAQGFFFSSA